MFDLLDLNMFREHAVREYLALPSRCRLKGMDRDLTQDECRLLAEYLAAVTMIKLTGLIPEVYTAVNQSVND